MSPSCNGGTGKPDQETVTGSGERRRARHWGEGDTWRWGVAEVGFEAHCGGGVMAVRLGGGGRQVSRRPRRVRAWRPHGRPPCSLLPPCLPPAWPWPPRCPSLGDSAGRPACLPPPVVPLPLLSLPLPSWDANFPPVFSLFRGFFEFLPASMVAFVTAKCFAPPDPLYILHLSS